MKRSKLAEAFSASENNTTNETNLVHADVPELNWQKINQSWYPV